MKLFELAGISKLKDLTVVTTGEADDVVEPGQMLLVACNRAKAVLIMKQMLIDNVHDGDEYYGDVARNIDGLPVLEKLFKKNNIDCVNVETLLSGHNADLVDVAESMPDIKRKG